MAEQGIYPTTTITVASTGTVGSGIAIGFDDTFCGTEGEVVKGITMRDTSVVSGDLMSIYTAGIILWKAKAAATIAAGTPLYTHTDGTATNIASPSGDTIAGYAMAAKDTDGYVLVKLV